MNNLNPYINPIRYYRKKKGLTQEDLANALGFRMATISSWELGKNKPHTEYIPNMAEVFGIPASELYAQVYQKQQSDDSVVFPMNTKRRILVYGNISAGKPTFAQEEITDYLYTDLGTSEDKIFGLRVSGNSMNNCFLTDGSIAIVRQCSYVDNGTVAVVRVNDEDATVKKFYQEGKTVRLVPCSTDPSYEDQVYDLTKTRIAIIGQVIGYQGRM